VVQKTAKKFLTEKYKKFIAAVETLLLYKLLPKSSPTSPISGCSIRHS